MEVERRLQAKREDRGEVVPPPCRCAQCTAMGDPVDCMLTVQEYLALKTTETVLNFDGLCKARASKPKRAQKDDVRVPEAPAFRVGAEDSGAGAAQV